MAIFKHPESGFWWLDFRTPDGQRVRRTTQTKDRKAAQEFHDKVKAQAWRVEKLGDRPDYSFDDAALAYLKDCANLRDYRSKVCQVAYWREKFGGQPLSSLTTGAIMDALPTHRVVRSGPARPMTPATKNRYLSTINKMLNNAAKMGWMDAAPRTMKFKEPRLRESWLTQNQARDLINAIEPGWMQDICIFALATGMRAGEILSLEWRQVDKAQRLASVLAAKAKSGSSRPVPLNDDAMSVIERRTGKHKQFVFARAEQESLEIDRRIWVRALKKAGIPAGFRFHDLRHTWASWHTQAGTPTMMLQMMGGWKTLSMLNRYSHLNASHLHARTAASNFLGRIWPQPEPETKTPPVEVALVA